jgi:deazaflavin-dependent oxidoreductase (nitroreductase family)
MLEKRGLRVGEVVTNSPRERVSERIERYLASDGEDGYLWKEDGYLWKGVSTLPLTTRGRRTKKLRRTALIFGEHGGDYLIVASRGGAPRHPQWFENLAADQMATIQAKASVLNGRAHAALPEEKPKLWQIMCEIWPAYNDYQAKTTREIPLVIIETKETNER